MPTPRELLQQALGLHQAGDLRAAEQLYRAVLATEPRNADAHHLLGVIALVEDRPDEAIDHIQAAIDCNPRAAQFHKHLGAAHQATGNRAAAIDAYRQQLARESMSAAAHVELADALKADGQLAEAESQYRRALAIDPDLVAAHNNLGDTLQAQGRLAEALASLRQAERLRPDLAAIQFNLGNCCQAQNLLPEAAAAYRQCVALEPNLAPAWRNLGTVLNSMRQFAEAAECHRTALRLAPDDVAAHVGLGIASHSLGDLPLAKASYRRALAIDPDDVLAHFNLASVLQSDRRLAEAQAEYEACTRLAPDKPEMLLQLGKCLQVQGHFDEAIERYRQAIAIDPDFKHTHYFYGTLLLSRGDYAAGWREYEWRLKDIPRTFRAPKWEGEDLDGRRILVHAEWGLGDTLMFIRFVPMVEARGGKVILEAQPELISLLRASGFAELVPAGSESPPHDVHVPLLSLPRIFGTSIDSIPAPVPYLAARDERVEQWRERLPPGRELKVGIQWHGSSIALGEGRAIPLAALEPLARVPGVKLIGLQVGQGREQLAEAPFVDTITDLGDALRDFHDTAAVMRSLDLVIASDTAPVHLAGALGVNVWVAVPYAADWRWQQDREDCPWYPTMRLFRQTAVDDWSVPLARIAAELAEVVAKRGGGH